MGRGRCGTSTRRTAYPRARCRCDRRQLQPFHDIRVRNYEPDLTACRIPLSDVLDPIGVVHITADVTAIDTTARTITFSGSDGSGSQDYDRLVFALGSSVAQDPDYPHCANRL